ncbi:phage tail protein [Pseudomonas prosekii]|uniref:Phage-related protein, tail component n=1 Tax=Pseudomonas prosekii TaxID=1148509 RepID=A0A1H1S0Q5_9PSED|nr:phage tail protein [Pseudomonas prosekii]SDS41525.1 Phage-related protein, tail component [Pseudomonas prosekii]
MSAAEKKAPRTQPRKRRSIAGSKGGEAKQKQPSIASNGVPSIATARIVYLWSWGPIVGPVNGLRSIKLDGTPVQAEDGTLNFPGVKWQFRSGELNQTRLEGITEASNEISVNQELLSTTPWLHTINNSLIDAVRIRLAWPRLQSQDAKGNINGVRIEYSVEISTDSGPYLPVLNSFVDRKNITKYERSHRLELPAGSRWTIRLRRLTPEANSSVVEDGMLIEAIAEVVDSDQEYPLTAVGCLEYDAQQFGGDIAKVAALMRGRIIRVPANYDAATRTYRTSGTGTSNGIWDGSFQEAYTNNPAWIFYDLVLHPYYGLGERIDATMVDRWSLYRIGQYCDQMVPDGKGGQHPRFTCSIYFQKQADAYAVLQDLATNFHGMAYWDGSQIVVNADMPGDPVYTYSPSQILNNGEIKYEGTRARDRHTLAMVAWDNPDQGFETDKEPVFDEDAMAELGMVRELAVDAFGCTSLGQAQRAGQWALMTEQLQTRGAVMRVGLDGQIPKPGQVIAIADPALAVRANGGRISAVAGRVITLDRDTVVPAGARLFVNLPSGKSEARVVKSAAGRALTVMADYSEVPEAECGWALDYDDLKLMQFYVRNVTRPEWHQYQFEMIQHEPSKFNAIDFGAVVDVRPITGIPIGTQAAPARVLLSQHVVVEQGIAVTSMTIAWDAAPGAVGYDVEWRWGAREWTKVPRTGELMAEVRGIYSGQYLARVRAISALNVASIPTNSVLTDLLGKTGAPPAVSFLTASTLLFGIGLKWGFPAGAEDTQRTEIWYSPTTSLEQATKLSDLAYPQKDYTLQGLAAGVTFFFWARLVDRIGNIGPWYPAGLGVMGQSSSDAADILEMIAGQISESELGQHLLDRIDLIDGSGPGSVNERLQELQDEIGDLVDALVYVPTDAYVRDNTVRVGDNLWTAIVNVPAAADGSNAPPNPTYWVNSGQSIRTANGIAAQVTKNTTDISTVDGKTTATASQLQAVQASLRNDDGSGDLLDALNGWQATASYAQEVRVRTEQDFAQTQRTTLLDSRVGTSESKISIVETTMVTNQVAMAQQVETLKASVGNNQAAIQAESTARSDAVGSLATRVDTAQAKADGASAAVQETSSALATTNGKLSAIWSVKMELTANGQPYAAGFGLGLEGGASGTTSSFVVRADTFAVMNTSTQNPEAFFAITGGQTFMRSSFIEDGTITNAKIGSYISSTNYIAGQQGWILNKDGTLEINGVVPGQGRLVINSLNVSVYDANNVLRVRLGYLG